MGLSASANRSSVVYLIMPVPPLRGPMPRSSYPRSGVTANWPRPVPPMKNRSWKGMYDDRSNPKIMPIILEVVSVMRCDGMSGMYQSAANTCLWNLAVPGKIGPPETSVDNEKLDPSEGKIGLFVLLREMT